MNRSIIALDTIGPTPEKAANTWAAATKAATSDLDIQQTTQGKIAPAVVGGVMGLEVDDGTPQAMEPWAYGQLCATLGAPVGFLRKLSTDTQLRVLQDRWDAVPSGAVRHVRTSEGSGRIAAFLGPRFTPIDYGPTVDLVHSMFPEHTLAGASFGSLMMRLQARSAEPLTTLPTGPVFSSVEIRNSEVGFSAWEILFSLWVQVCSNGMTIRLGGKRSLFRCLHVGWTEEKLREAIKKADIMAQVADAESEVSGLIDSARSSEWSVDDVRATLIKPLSPRAKTPEDGSDVNGRTFEIHGFRPPLSLTERIVEQFESEEKNLWGLTQAITAVSQDSAVHDRAELDEWAGRMLLRGVTKREIEE